MTGLRDNDRGPRTTRPGSLTECRDALYASNGARPDAAHYSASVKRLGAYRWEWEVVHWPETYNGYTGRVYPGIDWRTGDVERTEAAARRAVDRAIKQRRQQLAWENESDHWDVPE